ncbi:rhodanese-like domain-containing protein [Kangiella sp.]|uniref:rhodanese-like domain-containing protein n=1 Tax=Kangiella sp. TaxID=1920245 RepID=UPI003A8DBB37
MSIFKWQESEAVQLISPQDLKQWSSQSDAPLLIDVRDESDYGADQELLASLSQESRIQNIPITEFASHINQLDPDQPLVLVCQVGQKSFNAASLLIQADFSSVYSVHGGIEAVKRVER